MTKARLYAIGTSTTLACHQRQLTVPPWARLQTASPCAGKERPPATGGGPMLSHMEGDETREMRWLRGEDPHRPVAQPGTAIHQQQ